MLKCWKDKPKPIIRTAYERTTKPDGDSIPIALVVGHNEAKQGAENYLGESEWIFNTRIARKVQEILSGNGHRSALVFRPKSGGYRHECRYVAKKVEELGCIISVHLHFNWGPSGARGCEVLISNDGTRDSFLLADKISDVLNEKLSIEERHNDGVKKVYKGHSGFQMLQEVEAKDISAVLIEPCFANYRTSESAMVFENEDNYARALAMALSRFLATE